MNAKIRFTGKKIILLGTLILYKYLHNTIVMTDNSSFEICCFNRNALLILS